MKKESKVKRLLGRGSDLLREQKLDDALDSLLEACELDPDNPETHYYIGIVYARMERYDRSIQHLEKVLNSELTYINLIHAKMILGYVYTIREEYEEALEQFQGIVKAGFNSAQAYAAIGFVLDRLGDFKAAVMNLYRSIEIDPNNANAHNSLGYIYAESNINLDQALTECKKAVALDGDNPAYLDSLGWVCYKLGRISQAKSYLTKALKKSQGNEEIRRHLKQVNESHPGR